MYTADNFKKADEETFILKISPDRDFKILQLTDLHLGFGLFSKKRDQLAAAGADFYPVYGSIPDSLCNGFWKS